MRRFLLSIILICLLTVPASAHPGGTDASGGHVNSDTGEYHYHHGYSAHDHTDMDGDGDLDCPYNFVDKSGQNSGSPSSSSSVRASSDTDYYTRYWEGYHDAEPIAYEDGYEAGLEKGRAEGYADGRTEALTTVGLAIAWLGIIGFLIGRIVYRSCRKRRAAEEAEQAAKLRRLQDDYGKLIRQRDRKYEELQRQSAEQISRLRQAANTSRISALLQSHDPGGQSGLQIPNGVEICGDVVSAGDQGPDTPYGSYTVYTSPHGKCYHSMRGCSGAHNPQCIQEMKYRKVPHCTRCVNLTVAMMKCPDWYIRYKQVLAGEYKPK